MEAMRMISKQSLGLLSFVVQQQGDAGPGDVPLLRRVIPRCHYFIEERLYRKNIWTVKSRTPRTRLSPTCSSSEKRANDHQWEGHLLARAYRLLLWSIWNRRLFSRCSEEGKFDGRRSALDLELLVHLRHDRASGVAVALSRLSKM